MHVCPVKQKRFSSGVMVVVITDQSVVIKRLAPELATPPFFYVSILYCSVFFVHVIR
jgi:hypothetical protein